MYLYAVLSDIHANYSALKAVAQDARRIARQEHVAKDNFHFISLGDVVDYGPRPNQCMEWIRKNTTLCIKGNHDRNVASSDNEAPDSSIDERFWPMTLWTRRTLKPVLKRTIGQWRENINLNKAGSSVALPGLNNMILFHSDLELGDRHIKTPDDARHNFPLLRRYGVSCGLFGHTHIQGYFSRKPNGEVETYLTCTDGEKIRINDGLYSCGAGQEWFKPSGRRVLINPGSVGQPRRHYLLKSVEPPPIPKANYMLLKVNGKGYPEFKFRQVDYNVDETIEQLRAIRWGAESHSIYKDKEDENLELRIDPRLKKVLNNINDTLPDLIQNVLIEKLRTR